MPLINHPRNHTSKTTKASQIRKTILHEITTGIYKDTKKLPPEEEMAAHWNVSRPVVRDALAELEREGFITRSRRIGTLVNQRVSKIKVRMDLEIEFMDLVSCSGYTPSLDCSRMEMIAADEWIAKRLEIRKGEKVVLCERRILADGKPAIFAKDYFAKALLRTQNLSGIDWTLPIFEIMADHCDSVITMDLTEMRAVGAEKRVAGLLGLAENTPILYLDEVGYTKGNQPVLWSEEYYVDGFFNLMLMRKKI